MAFVVCENGAANPLPRFVHGMDAAQSVGNAAALEQGRRDPLWSSVMDIAEAFGVQVMAFVVPKDERVALERAPVGRPPKRELPYSRHANTQLSRTMTETAER
jgi:hypothetical protein